MSPNIQHPMLNVQRPTSGRENLQFPLQFDHTKRGSAQMARMEHAGPGCRKCERRSGRHKCPPVKAGHKLHWLGHIFKTSLRGVPPCGTTKQSSWITTVRHCRPRDDTASEDGWTETEERVYPAMGLPNPARMESRLPTSLIHWRTRIPVSRGPAGAGPSTLQRRTSLGGERWILDVWRRPTGVYIIRSAPSEPSPAT